MVFFHGHVIGNVTFPDELREMEGIERGNIEARIQWLRDIQALLDGAMLLIHQYNSVASNSSTSGINLASAPQPVAQPQGGTGVFTSTNIGPETGARPKHSSPKKSPSTTGTINSNSASKADITDLLKADSQLVGATGSSEPQEEIIPEWQDPRKEEHCDEMDEIRRRRLEKFLSETQSGNAESEKVTHSEHND